MCAHARQGRTGVVRILPAIPCPLSAPLFQVKLDEKAKPKTRDAVAIVDQGGGGFTIMVFDNSGKKISTLKGKKHSDLADAALVEEIRKLTAKGDTPGLSIVNASKGTLGDYSSVETSVYPAITKFLGRFYLKALEEKISASIGGMPTKVVIRQTGKIRAKLMSADQAEAKQAGPHASCAAAAHHQLAHMLDGSPCSAAPPSAIRLPPHNPPQVWDKCFADAVPAGWDYAILANAEEASLEGQTFFSKKDAFPKALESKAEDVVGCSVGSSSTQAYSLAKACGPLHAHRRTRASPRTQGTP